MNEIVHYYPSKRHKSNQSKVMLECNKETIDGEEFSIEGIILWNVFCLFFTYRKSFARSFVDQYVPIAFFPPLVFPP